MGDPVTPPRTLPQGTGKKGTTIKQAYREEYAEQFPGIITKSRLGIHHAFCTVCRVDIVISHGGINDIKRHFGTKKHESCAKITEGNSKMTSFFCKPKDHSVINAEVMFTEFIVEHGISVAATDHAGQLFRKMFPDSQIAQKYGSARTKTTYIMKTLGDNSAEQILANIKTGPFSFATDGSNDYEDVKLYPICVRYFDEEQNQVLSVLLSLKECDKSSTGENIYKLMEEDLDKYGVPWKNAVSFSTDNASVMVGIHKGVAAYLKKKAPSIYIAG